jgi:rRNA maturation endonuclease Nob1
MNEFFDEFDSDESILQSYEAECQGCDMFLPVNDLGLCEDCAGKLERDMIRKRDWPIRSLHLDVPRISLKI